MCTVCTAHVHFVYNLVVKIIYKIVYENLIHACIPKSSFLAWETKKLKNMHIVCTVCTANVHTLDVKIISEVYFKYMKNVWFLKIIVSMEVTSMHEKLWPESRRRFWLFFSARARRAH